MKRFHFPLERVRRWRQDQADLEEFKLQQLFGERNGLMERRQLLLTQAETSERAVLSSESVEAQELAALESYRQHVAQRKAAIEREQGRVEQRIADQRHAVVEAQRRFELLDRLQHKAFLSWTAARDKEEEELAAELYLAKRVRRPE